MNDLFGSAEDAAHVVDMPGAALRFFPAFLAHDQADNYFRALLKEIQWREESVLVWGKWHRQPRLIAWYGDGGANYSYSGRSLTPLPWTHTLTQLRTLVEKASSAQFNSVLLNQYRDQNDSMGWHSDNEPELGKTPTIASVSLGDSRTFLFKHRSEKNLGIRRIVLSHGSLLIMSGETQKNWMHSIDKERLPCGIRINLTFRFIFGKGKG